MLVNSELPLCMLKDNDRINEYDFILYHLCLKYPSYKEFFKRESSRLSMLDNSAYEFFIKKEAFNEGAFISIIEELNPSYYIVPDVLMDKVVTIENYNKWRTKSISSDSKPMLIPQGRTLREWLSCYFYFLESGCSAIGIPFHNDFFYDLGLIFYHNNENALPLKTFPSSSDVYYALGRYVLLQYLKDTSLIKKEIHYHLLGSHWVWEKHFYKNFDFIKTFDTGFPVKCAIEGFFLDEVCCKPHIIIDDFFEEQLSDSTKMLIERNISYFKNL